MNKSKYTKPKNVWYSNGQPVMAQITDSDGEILEIEANGDGEFIFRVLSVGHGSPVVHLDVLKTVLEVLHNNQSRYEN